MHAPQDLMIGLGFFFEFTDWISIVYVFYCKEYHTSVINPLVHVIDIRVREI